MVIIFGSYPTPSREQTLPLDINIWVDDTKTNAAWSLHPTAVTVNIPPVTLHCDWLVR